MYRKIGFVLIVLTAFALLFIPSQAIPQTNASSIFQVAGKKTDHIGWPISGWTIYLRNSPDSPNLKTTQTNLLGYYSFSNLNPGTYWVVEEEKEGWEAILPIAQKIEICDSFGCSPCTPCTPCPCQPFWEVNFKNRRRPTITPTRTRTPTNTPTQTATMTATPSATPTRTATASRTPTRTISVTKTQTSSPTGTPSKTRTITRTPTATKTKTPICIPCYIEKPMVEFGFLDKAGTFHQGLVILLPSGQVKDLTEERDSSPQWNIDGTLLAWNRLNDNGFFKVWVGEWDSHNWQIANARCVSCSLPPEHDEFREWTGPDKIRFAHMRIEVWEVLANGSGLTRRYPTP